MTFSGVIFVTSIWGTISGREWKKLKWDDIRYHLTLDWIFHMFYMFFSILIPRFCERSLEIQRI